MAINIDIPSRYGVMEAYLRETVHVVEDLYVGTLCNNPKDAFSPNDDVVVGQMFIVWSPYKNCEIRIGQVEGNVYQYSNVTVET